MVKTFVFGPVRVGYCVLILLCLKTYTESTNFTDKLVSKRQTDSFVVSANYGVQSGTTNNQHLPATYEQYQTQTEIATNSTTTNDEVLYGNDLIHEVLPTASAWKVTDLDSNPFMGYERHLPTDPAIYVANAYQPYRMQEIGATMHPSYAINQFSASSSSNKKPETDIVYGSTNNDSSSTPQWYNQNIQQNHERVDNNIHPEYDNTLTDIHKPSVQELQNMISKIVKGTTKVHQVVKVPAVYEIHLQEEEDKSEPHHNVALEHFQVALPQWTNSLHSQSSSGKWKNQPFRKKPQYPRNNRYTTKTWNLPSKIKYFNNKPVNRVPMQTSSKPIYGKYSYPKPFSMHKWGSSGTSNSIPTQSWNTNGWQTPPNYYYGSVNVPMTPGSTAVTFLNPTFAHGQAAAPDLSLYYAKKKELENHQNKYGYYRRNDKAAESRRDRMRYGGGSPMHRSGGQVFSPFNWMNYIIHVREKPGK